MQKLKDIKTPENPTTFRRTLGVTIWLVATSRNALIVVFASLAAYYADISGYVPFILTGTVRSGLPALALPPFHTTVLSPNGTTVEMNLLGMVSAAKTLTNILLELMDFIDNRIGSINCIGTGHCRSR